MVNRMWSLSFSLRVRMSLILLGMVCLDIVVRTTDQVIKRNLENFRNLGRHFNRKFYLITLLPAYRGRSRF
ncbi:hypothetical protein LVD17_09865 [Fulvivirga ulvae]|uniref:hypothetical protein n=1 Tax=Fulvivirga ulvae TaxID=2904245 RepID=UPI001F36258F|nr:hypothetical protein [Fulvivirga ulvae]UII34119.1 hypothetical protein LVD17_09865 [Fulvivirga ulvae]